MEKVRPWCGPTLGSRTSLYVAQSCPRVGLTHGLGWVGLGRDFSVFGGLGGVHNSKKFGQQSQRLVD